MKKKEKENNYKVILYSIVNPWTIVSIIIIIFCLSCAIYESNKVKDYEKIKVNYVKDCSKLDICDNNYYFKIDDKVYGIKPSFETIEKYKKNNYAYYNKEDPSENFMKSSWNYLNILFIIVIIISSVSYYKELKK